MQFEESTTYRSSFAEGNKYIHVYFIWALCTTIGLYSMSHMGFFLFFSEESVNTHCNVCLDLLSSTVWL